MWASCLLHSLSASLFVHVGTAMPTLGLLLPDSVEMGLGEYQLLLTVGRVIWVL